MKKLNVQETIEIATKMAIKSPFQGIENVLQCAIMNILGLTGTVADAGSHIENYEELLDIFMHESNIELIKAGRTDQIAKMDVLRNEAKNNPINIAIDTICKDYGMVWGIYEEERGWPFYTTQIDAPDGEYEAVYTGRDYFAGHLTNDSTKISVQNGQVDVYNVMEVFGKEFHKYDDHIYIESIDLKDGKLHIFCGS